MAGSVQKPPGADEAAGVPSSSERAEQFTPGPWAAIIGDLIRVRAGETIVCGVHRVGKYSERGNERRAEAEANAALIAAAPDLYEALKEAADVLEACERRLRQNGSFEQAKVVDEQVGKARAALSKAGA